MNQSQPEISVIIPAYNAEKTIGKCLKSLKNQNVKKGYEIIVVDDGSIDRTKQVVKKFRNILLLEQKHKGPAAARNLGAKNANGKILLFTDADCFAKKDWIKEMIKPFENKEIIGVQGAYGTKQKSIFARFAQFEIEERYDRMRKNDYIDFIGSYSAGYKKDIFLKSGGFDESFPMASGEDPALSFKLSELGYKMVFNPKAVVYHKHPDTLKKYLRQKFWRAYWRVLLYKKYPKKIKSESYTPQTLKIQIFLTYLFSISSILVFFGLNAIIPLLIFFVILISTLPLSYKNFRKDKMVGLFSPFIILMRSISFSLGLLYGFVRMIL